MDAKDAAQTFAAKSLTPTGERFVSQYVRDLNGTQAAIGASYAPSGARLLASEMLSNVSITEAVRAADQEILQSNQATVARVVRQFALIACFDPASILPKLDGCLRLASFRLKFVAGLQRILGRQVERP